MIPFVLGTLTTLVFLLLLKVTDLSDKLGLLRGISNSNDMRSRRILEELQGQRSVIASLEGDAAKGREKLRSALRSILADDSSEVPDERRSTS